MNISKHILSVAAMAVAIAPVAAGAATPVVGTVSGAKNAVVARDGRLLAVSSSMPLYAGDRIVTRAGGAAQVAIAGACTVNLGASAMVVAQKGACVQPTSFDAGRAAYAGNSSALQGGGRAGGAVVAGTAVVVGGGGAYLLLRDHDNNDDNDPAPVNPNPNPVSP